MERYKYEVVTPDEELMELTANLVSGRPDCWDLESRHETFVQALAAAKKIKGRVRIRLIDDPNPNLVVSDLIFINPKKHIS